MPDREIAQPQTYYITTPIYYTSGRPHIGHSYTTVAADAMARYRRRQGYDVMFVTGTDEHGLKVQERAAAAGLTPQTYVDGIVAEFKEIWQLLGISYDRFIRTTDPEHVAAIQEIFTMLYERGDIYLDTYEGWYCTPCESYWTETQLADGKCPDCGREVVLTQEETYFFRQSKYGERIIELYREHPEFIQPPSRMHEMLNNFLLPGLEDVAVSRTSFDWGVHVPFDEKHVVYVWVDALFNYLTVLGFPNGENPVWERYWPADVQLMGKEIVRFHTILWPALLMALDMPVPKQAFGHGWLLFRDSKMSKSVGNVVDPAILCERYGVDAIRYYLLREIPFGSDGNFSNEALVTRINADLANDLGNLVSRTTAMIARYFDGLLPEEREAAGIDDELLGLAGSLAESVEANLNELQYSQALADIWRVIGRANKYIDETTPWILARDEAQRPRLAAVLHNLAATLRQIAILLEPFMPATGPAILAALGVGDDTRQSSWASARETGLWQPAAPITAAKPLFPRLDLEAELDYMQSILEADKGQESPAPEAAEESVPAPVGIATIQYDDFAKLDLRVAVVTACDRVPKADKLLRFDLDVGSLGTRQVVSGIADSYEPGELVGRRVILVANLAKRRVRGTESEGMLLCAEAPDGSYRLLGVSDDVEAGSEVS
ncbi:MAG: methionine--tRNA ligase [Bacillota bacterium]|nr:methionine--tRNA ligase [Bacillota bacterium]